MNDLQKLMRYKCWADALLHEAATQVSLEELTRSRPIVFGSMIQTLSHICAMDGVWRAHLSGESHGLDTRNPENRLPLDALSAEQQRMNDWYISYVDRLSATHRSETVNFEFIGGGPGSMTRHDILLHVVNHGTYHRGNVTGMMYECGLMPPTTDYPVFLKTPGSD